MIQDIYPHKLYNEYRPDAVITDDSRILAFERAMVLLNKKDEISIPTYAQIRQQLGDKIKSKNIKFTFVFRVDETDYFLTDKLMIGDESASALPASEYEYMDLRTIRGDQHIEQYERYAIMTGKHLNDWYQDMKRCGRCGSEMAHSENERAMICTECHYTAYPRIMPAVIVGVKNGDKLLLTKYRTGFNHNALIAGFVEIGETLEETVAREVMEEAGVHVKNIRYYKSQPWGIANDILTGFYCEVDGDDTITMDTGELKYAEWVAREDIILQPDNMSLTNEMMKMFKDGIEK